MLELIRTTGSVSRAEVARRSGLSKPTVSQALTGLLDSRLVREVGRESGRKGPGAVLFELNPESGWVVGLDVGRNWVRVALADITGRVVARRDERTRARSSATLVAQIGRIGHDVAADAGLKWSQVTHATVGNPGVLDPSRGQLSLAPEPARVGKARPRRGDPGRARDAHELRERRQPGGARRAGARRRPRRGRLLLPVDRHRRRPGDRDRRRAASRCRGCRGRDRLPAARARRPARPRRAPPGAPRGVRLGRRGHAGGPRRRVAGPHAQGRVRGGPPGRAGWRSGPSTSRRRGSRSRSPRWRPCSIRSL